MKNTVAIGQFSPNMNIRIFYFCILRVLYRHLQLNNMLARQKRLKSGSYIMLDNEKIKDILKNEYPYLISEYGVKRIGLFGSYAKGVQNEDSDIDIVAEFSKPIGLKFIEFI